MRVIRSSLGGTAPGGSACVAHAAPYAATSRFRPSAVANAGVSPYLGNDTAGTELHPYFNGSMDEVRFYNRALSASEVLTLVPEPGSTSLVMSASVLAAYRIAARRQRKPRSPT